MSFRLELSPNHLVDDTNIGLDDLDYLGADIIHVGGNGDAMVAILGHLYGEVNTLEEALLIDTGEDEAGFVKGFRTLGGGSDAYGRDGFSYAGIETAFLREGAGVGDHTEGVHLKAIVVMESHRLLLHHTGV